MRSELSKVLLGNNDIVVTGEDLQVLHLEVELEDGFGLTNHDTVGVRTGVLLVTDSQEDVVTITDVVFEW